MPDALVTLKSPINGENITFSPSECPPGMVDALILRGFIRVDPSKVPKTKEKPA